MKIITKKKTEKETEIDRDRERERQRGERGVAPSPMRLSKTPGELYEKTSGEFSGEKSEKIYLHISMVNVFTFFSMFSPFFQCFHRFFHRFPQFSQKN